MLDIFLENLKFYSNLIKANFELWLKEIELLGLMDIIIMTFVIYTVLVWFKRTRAAFVLKGIFIIGFFYLLARNFNLVMTTEVFEQFFAIILIAMVVIFQEELRRFFEQVAIVSFKQSHSRKGAMLMSREEVEILVRTVMDLTREKVGALIVIKGKDMLARHLQGGVALNGNLSEPLLKSIFDPHSAGHDGAVVIEGNRLVQFSAMLPLSKNLKKIQGRGTRHAAALGLSELTDALCIVVSEEKGTVAISRHGEIDHFSDPEKITLILERFYKEVNPKHAGVPLFEFLARNSLEKIYAVFLALTLWLVLVHGAKVTSKTYALSVNLGNISENFNLVEVAPKEVDVAFRGPRSAFYFLKDEQIKLFLQPRLKKGVQKVKIHSDNLVFPKNLVVEYFNPEEVKIRLEEKEASEKPEAVPVPVEKTTSESRGP